MHPLTTYPFYRVALNSTYFLKFVFLWWDDKLMLRPCFDAREQVENTRTKKKPAVPPKSQCVPDFMSIKNFFLKSVQFLGVAIIPTHKIPARHPFPALLSRDKGFSSFLCRLYILIADRHCSQCHSLGTYSSIPWLYCTSEDRMWNILRPRNKSTEISLWLVQIIPLVKGKETLCFSLEASEDSRKRKFSFQLPNTCGVCWPSCDPV